MGLHPKLPNFGGFVREQYSGMDAIVPLDEIAAALPLAEAYDGVDFTRVSDPDVDEA